MYLATLVSFETRQVPLMKAQGGGQKAGSFVFVHPKFELTGVGLVRDPREGGESHLVMKGMVKLLAKWPRSDRPSRRYYARRLRAGTLAGTSLAGPSDRLRQNRQA